MNIEQRHITTLEHHRDHAPENLDEQGLQIVGEDQRLSTEILTLVDSVNSGSITEEEFRTQLSAVLESSTIVSMAKTTGTYILESLG